MKRREEAKKWRGAETPELSWEDPPWELKCLCGGGRGFLSELCGSRVPMSQDVLPLGHCPTSKLCDSWAFKSQDSLPSKQKHMEQRSLHQLTKAVLSVMCQSPWGWNSRRAYCPPQVSNTKAGLQMLKISYTKIPSTCWNYKAEAAGTVSKSSSCSDTWSRWQGARLQRRPSSDIWGREH